MSPFVALLLSINLLLLALLAYVLWRMQQKLAQLHQRLETAQLLATPTHGQSPVITVEIHNPFELAAKENILAGPAAKLAPRLIERIVYARAAAQIAEELEQKGVKAQVTAHVD